MPPHPRFAAPTVRDGALRPVAFLLALAFAVAPAAAGGALLDALGDAAPGPPRSLRAERLLDRGWLRDHGVETPSRLAFDDRGALYVLDARSRRVVRLPIAETSPDGPSGGGEPLLGALAFGEDVGASWLPRDLLLDTRGSLLVLDRASASVAAFGRRGESLGSRAVDPALAEEARAPDARLLRDPYGYLWLLSPRDRDLVPLDERLARRRVARFLAPEESLAAPVAAAFLPKGGGWIADAGARALRRFDATGRLSAAVRAPDSVAFVPADLAADGSGALYVADEAGARVLVLDASGALLATHWLSGGDRAWRPGAIAWSPDDRLAVADPRRGEIWILSVERGTPP